MMMIIIQMAKSFANPLIMQFWLFVDETTDRPWFECRMSKIRCVCASYHNKPQLSWMQFYDYAMNVMQIICEFSSFARTLGFCVCVCLCGRVFGCIILSSHLFGLKNNRNESLFCAHGLIWIFHLQIWFDPGFVSSKPIPFTSSTTTKWICFFVCSLFLSALRKNELTREKSFIPNRKDVGFTSKICMICIKCIIRTFCVECFVT